MGKNKQNSVGSNKKLSHKTYYWSSTYYKIDLTRSLEAGA